jgi:hypothetical protein
MGDAVDLMLICFAILATVGTLILCVTIMSIVTGGSSNRKTYDEPDGSSYVQKHGEVRLD